MSLASSGLLCKDFEPLGAILSKGSEIWESQFAQSENVTQVEKLKEKPILTPVNTQ